MELSHSPGHDDHHASTRPCLSRTRPGVIVLRVPLAGAFQITCSALQDGAPVGCRGSEVQLPYLTLFQWLNSIVKMVDIT